MLISLITSDRYSTLYLPKWKEGCFYVTNPDGGENLFSITGDTADWRIAACRGSWFLDGQPDRLHDQQLFRVRIGARADEAFLFVEENASKYGKYARCIVPDRCSFSVGSGSSEDFVLHSSYVGRRHCELICENRAWRVRDCGSKVGTYVNGRRITSRPLKPGDVVSVLNQKFILLPGVIAFNAQNLDVTALKDKVHPLKAPVLPTETPVGEEPQVEYFHREPRFTSSVQEEDFDISAPDAMRMFSQQGSALLSLGPSLTSGLAMLLGGMANPVMGIGMLASSLIFPGIGRKQFQKLAEDEERARQAKYTKYIDDLDQKLDELSKSQQEQLKRQNPPPLSEASEILGSRKGLWNRRPDHADALDVRLGTGSIPVIANISFPEAKFNDPDDPMLKRLHEVAEKPRLLNDVPIMLQLSRFFTVGVSGPEKLRNRAVGQIVMQFCLHNGYDDLKLCVLGALPEELKPLRWLPHCWDDRRTVHLTATNLQDLTRLLPDLETLLADHRAKDGSEESEPGRSLVFLVTDAEIAHSGLLNRLLYERPFHRVHVITMAAHSAELPRRTNVIIGVRKNKCRMLWQDGAQRRVMDLVPDSPLVGELPALVSCMANTQLDLLREEKRMPKVVPFLDLFGVRAVSHLNLLNRWSRADPVRSLRAPFGISEDGELCMLDLHERGDGPHGLVAGTTGSGKSEMLMSLILSLAVCYSPQELSFVMIDYKGGGMAQAFEKLPHTAGIITNLDGNEINRSLMSIESELERRQRLFSETQKALNLRSLDIYKYQKLFRDGRVSEPLSHLVIISDEFAELKTQQPDFLQQLIRAARIGRSLGVHLILATQKPAGVVDDQIWSNSNFHICLRVQDTSDSQDVLKCGDAAKLTNVGSLYKQVGYGQTLVKAQSGWTGADYSPENAVLPDCSVDVLDDTGAILCREDVSIFGTRGASPQLDAVTDHVISLAAREGLKARALWLPPLEKKISRSALREKYTPADSAWELAPVLGELDDPAHQRRALVRIPLSGGKNTIVYGSMESGKVMLLQEVLEDLLLTHTAEQLNVYIVDSADDGLQTYKTAPQVGDVLSSDEDEKLRRMLDLLEQQIALRRKQLGGAMMAQTLSERLHQKGMGHVLVILHNILTLQELLENDEDRLKRLLAEGPRFGVSFLATMPVSSGLHYQLAQYFPQKYVLQMDTDDDYTNLLGRTNGFRPSPVRGRGLLREDALYEFQTAMAEHQPEAMCRELQKNWDGPCAHPIRTLPELVTADDLAPELLPDQPLILPVGFDTETMDPAFFDFGADGVHLILGESSSVVSALCELIPLAVKNGLRVTVIAEEELPLQEEEAVYLDPAALGEFLQSGMAGADAETAKHLILFPDFSSLYQSIGEDEASGLLRLLKDGCSDRGSGFVICGTAMELDRFKYEDWFQAAVSTANGLYLGEGFQEQFLLQSNAYLNEQIEFPMGYVLVRKQARKVKFLQTP